MRRAVKSLKSREKSDGTREDHCGNVPRWDVVLVAAEGASADVGATRYAPAEQSQAGENGASSQGDRAKEIEHDDLQIHVQSMMRFLRFAIVTICLQPVETREAGPFTSGRYAGLRLIIAGY